MKKACLKTYVLRQAFIGSYVAAEFSEHSYGTVVSGKHSINA